MATGILVLLWLIFIGLLGFPSIPFWDIVKFGIGVDLFMGIMIILISWPEVPEAIIRKLKK